MACPDCEPEDLAPLELQLCALGEKLDSCCSNLQDTEALTIIAKLSYIQTRILYCQYQHDLLADLPGGGD